MRADARSIACCVDGRGGSALVLREGARLRELTGARLDVVWATREATEADRAALAERVREVEGARPVVIPDEGDAAAAVMAWAAREGSALLIATTRRGPLTRLLPGGFVARLLSDAPCAVLVARPYDAESAQVRPPSGTERDPWDFPVDRVVEELAPLRPDDPLRDAAARIAEAGCSLPVVDADGALVGMLGEREVLVAVAPAEAAGAPTSELLQPDDPARWYRVWAALAAPVAEHAVEAEPAELGDPAGRAAELLMRHGRDALAVVDRWGRLAGVVRRSALLDEAGACAADAAGAGAPSPGPAYRHVACCVDGSPAALAAMRAAARVRALGPGALSVVHATQEAAGPQVREARRLVEEAARELGAAAALVHGDPPIAVDEWAREQGVDLLVLAPHRGSLERLLAGSFSRRLIHRAPCPVLVARAGAEGAEGATR